MADGTSGTKNVVQRMIDVMSEVGSIGKKREAPGLKYAFRGIDDITPVVQPLLVKHGVLLTQRILKSEREVVKTSAGSSMFSVRLEVEHTFRAPDGSTVISSSLGEAMDNMDKASNKAMTAALKATLTTDFMIPVNDPEADTEATPQAPIAGATAPRTQAASPRPAPKAAQRAQAPRPASSGAVFGNYGRSKGMPVYGASAQDLDFYANGCRRNLADPSKSRWHEGDRVLLAAIEAEIARQLGHPGPDDGPPPPGDEDAPSDAF